MNHNKPQPSGFMNERSHTYRRPGLPAHGESGSCLIGDANRSTAATLESFLAILLLILSAFRVCAQTPSVSTGPAQWLTSATTTLTGIVNPNGLTTTVRFEYGPTTAYGSTKSVTLSASGAAMPQSVAVDMGTLAQGTVFHYRLTATNAAGTSHGFDRTFVTTRVAGTLRYNCSDTGVTVTGPAQWLSGSITIPSEIGGLPVTAVGFRAFLNQTGMTGISLPPSLTAIGEHAFDGCEAIATLSMPGSVKHISNWAFALCTRLVSVDLPDSLETIGDYAFRGCSLLGGIAFPESATKIGESAFSGCHSLTMVAIPRNVSSIGAYTFDDCPSLTGYTVDPGNTTFASQDGLLFNRALDTIIRCPGGYSGAYSIPGGVTRIAPQAFSRCSELHSISFNAELTELGKEAFAYCSSLPSVDLPANLAKIEESAFKDCSNLLSVSIPAGVTSLGHSAFNGCSKLATVVLPGGLAELPGGVFGGCASLTDIVIPDTVTSIGPGAFVGCESLEGILIPEGVTTISASAFNRCSGLVTITIPPNVTYIGHSAFYGCSRLTAVVIPPSVKTLEGSVFQRCTSLVTASLPQGLDRISGSMFAECASLSTLAIPASVRTIEWDAFWGCSVLRSLTIPDGVAYIGSRAFFGCANLAAMVIPPTVASTGTEVFRGCASLESVVLPESLTAVEGATFFECANLTSVVLPANLTRIGYSAFYGCSKLAEIALPSGLASIESRAFHGCSSLTSIFLPQTVTTIGEWAFSGCSSLSGISVAYGNTSFSGLNGVLFNHNRSTLIRYPNTRSGSYAVPDTVTRIEAEAFGRCAALTALHLPAAVSSIGVRAFEDCASLTEITVNDANPTFRSIGGALFDKTGAKLLKCPPGRSGCYAIPEGVTDAGEEAFNWCVGLTSVTIPASATGSGFSGRNLLWSCRNLNAIEVDSEHPYFSSHDGIWYDKFRFTLIRYPAGRAGSYEVPEGVFSIGDWAFMGCEGITSVYVPASVSGIGTYAFLGCSGLTRVIFAGAAPYVGANVFENTGAGFQVTYLQDAPGFTEPTWEGYPAAAVPDPTIIRHPSHDAIIPVGESVTLSVLALGGEGTRYQWFEGLSGDVSKPVANATFPLFTTSRLSSTTRFWVRVQNATLHTDSETATISVAAPTAIQIWRLEKFGTLFDEGSASDAADPDHDGICNLLEFALGTSPTQTNPVPFSQSLVVLDHERYLRLVIPRNPASSGLSFVVEVADSPSGPWHSGVDYTVTEADTPTLFQIRDRTPVSASARRFMRLGVGDSAPR